MSFNIDDELDALALDSKPGSKKGRMRSSRFNHVELKQLLRDYTKAILIPELGHNEFYDQAITTIEANARRILGEDK